LRTSVGGPAELCARGGFCPERRERKGRFPAGIRPGMATSAPPERRRTAEDRGRLV